MLPNEHPAKHCALAVVARYVEQLSKKKLHNIVPLAMSGDVWIRLNNVCFFKVNALDLAPNYAGSLTSLVNTTSTFAGIITPYLIGLLTPDVSKIVIN